MKIVHCFFTMQTGGAQLLAIDMLNILCRSHETALIVVNDQHDEALLQMLDKKVAVYCLNREAGSFNPLPLIRLNRLLRQLKPDIIHCHERKMIQVIHHKRAKTVYTIHDVDFPTNTFSRYDALVAISKSVAVNVSRRVSFPIDTVCNGIRVDSFRKRTTYRVPIDSPIRLVQVSRLMHEKKGQDILLRAIAKLTKDHGCPPITLDFIGAGGSMEYLTKLAKTLEIDSLVNFLGDRDRGWIAHHLADYHLLVQPSRYEGFGLTVVEGLAAGLPVVASNIDGPAEIMAGLPAGRLFTSEHIDDCAAALASVIDAYRTTPSQLEQAVNQTQATVRQKFSMETTVAGYSAVYHRIMQRVGSQSVSQRWSDQLRRSFFPQQRPV